MERNPHERGRKTRICGTVEFVAEEAGVYHYLVEGWIDHFKTWQGDLRKKFEAGQPLMADIRIGVRHRSKRPQKGHLPETGKDSSSLPGSFKRRQAPKKRLQWLTIKS